jgi:hypothetical protein
MPIMKKSLAKLRQEYLPGEFTRSSVDPTPFQPFHHWLRNERSTKN